jgi:hypothetical protein
MLIDFFVLFLFVCVLVIGYTLVRFILVSIHWSCISQIHIFKFVITLDSGFALKKINQFRIKNKHFQSKVIHIFF